jgi:hypothetical protein
VWPRSSNWALLRGASTSPLDATAKRAFPAALSILVKEPELTPVRLFLIFFTLGVVYYLLDCLFEFKRYPDLPWYETGIRSGGRRGFLMTVGLFVAAIYFLIFGKKS